MAKKKTVVTTEEEVIPQELDYNKDLKDKSFIEVALDTPEEPTEELKEEVKEEVKETPKEEETVKFDPAELKKEVIEETKTAILEGLKGKDETETKENVDHYQQFQKDFLEKNNRQPTWFEVAKDMEEQAIIKLEEKQAAKQKEQEDATNKEKEIETQNNEATNKYVKDTLDELYENDKMPKIQNKDDEDDYGIRTQKALFKTVVDINTERIKNNQTPKTIKEIFYEDFKMPKREVAGADAPVNMGRGGFTPDDTQELDYSRDISGPRNSIRNILNRAVRRG